MSGAGNNSDCVSFLKAAQEFEDIDASDEDEENEEEKIAASVTARKTEAHPSVRDDERALIKAKPVSSVSGRLSPAVNARQPTVNSTAAKVADNDTGASPSSGDSGDNGSGGGGGGRCGFWRFKCSAIQRLNQFELFLALLTLNGLVVGMQGAMKSALLTKLERRYSLDSTTSSLIMTANDMVFLPSVLLVSYFGSLGHRPRLLALSCFGYGVAALLFALPYFVFGPMPTPVDDPGAANFQLGFACPANATHGGEQRTRYQRDDDGSALLESRVALALFMLSGFIEGVAAAPFFNLGIAFIDDVTGDFSGVFIGLVIASRLLSPTLAYQIYGKVIVRLHENLTPSEARQRGSPFYIPAWWLGFCCIGCVAICISLPMALFPKRPYFNGEKYRAAVGIGQGDGDEAEEGEGGGRRPGLLCRLLRRVNRKRAAAMQARRAGARLRKASAVSDKAVGSFRGFLQSIKRLLSNPVYVCLLAGNLFEFMEINCVIAYMPKYLEMHFRIGSGDAAILTGVAGPGANVIGILISSAVASQVDWQVPQLAKYHACVNLFGILAAMTGFFFTCPPVTFYGGLPENRTFTPDCTGGSPFSRMSPFATGCSCNSTMFKPVCISNINFYSPCAANCFMSRGNVSCSCAVNGTAASVVTEAFPFGSLREKAGQLCPDRCSSTVYIYLAVFVLIKLVRLSARSQEAVLQMRCVRPKDKALGLGINSFAFSIGGIWVPTFIGFLFSKACKVREVTGSGKNCLFYDTDKFRYSFVGFTTAALVPACLFFLLAWVYTERDPKYTDMSSRRATVELPMAASNARRLSDANRNDAES